MLTLYHAPRSRSSRMVWLLEELGVPYEIKTVSIRRGDGSGAEERDYRRIHPHAKVPALVHDGATIFETSAIALYLTDAFPEPGLGPRIGDPQRGPYLTWLAYSAGVIEPSVAAKMLKIEHRYGTFGWAPADEVAAYLKRTLEAKPYLLGDTFSAADIVIGGSLPILMNFGMFPKEEPFTGYTARLADRPAWQRTKDKGAA